MKIDDTPVTIEIMCEAHWDLTASVKWKDIPDEWKTGYRNKMAAAIYARNTKVWTVNVSGDGRLEK